MKFQYYYSDIRNTTPMGVVSLDDFVRVVKKPKPGTKAIYDQIEKATEQKNEALRARLKTKLYYFTPCAIFSGGRAYKNIVKFTGLMVLDFDKIDYDLAPGMRDALFKEYDFICAAWLSSSRKGVRAFVKIPVVKTVKEFQEHFRALNEIMEQYIGWDTATKNAALPLFMSYDPEIKYRSDARVFSLKKKEVRNTNRKTFTTHKTLSTDTAVRNVQTALYKITDQGHQILRNTSLALGGYVAAGAISQDDALQLIDNEIDNHPYLSKKASVYKKTARWGITNGQLKPLNT